MQQVMRIDENTTKYIVFNTKKVNFTPIARELYKGKYTKKLMYICFDINMGKVTIYCLC